MVFLDIWINVLHRICKAFSITDNWNINFYRLFGDYESLTAGKAKDGMVDMTGGVGESIELEDYRTEELKKKLFKILKSSYEDRSLMSASIRVIIIKYLLSLISYKTFIY